MRFDLGPVHTKTIVNANASKRKLFYAFRPSVHTKTMKTLTVIECLSKMAYTRVLSCVMLALISRIIASIQLNHAIIDIQENYKRRRLNLSRLLSTTTSTFTRVKRLRCRRESKERRFWTRPGRTSAWWNNFADQVVIPEEWKENFRMSRDSLYNLAEELRPYIQGEAGSNR